MGFVFVWPFVLIFYRFIDVIVVRLKSIIQAGALRAQSITQKTIQIVAKDR